MSSRPEPPENDSGCGEEHGHPVVPSVPADVLERAATLFRAVGEPARLWLLERLSHGERCVTDLAAESGDHLSTVSQRLRVLRSEGLVRRRREGKHYFYTLADDHVKELIESAIDHAREDL